MTDLQIAYIDESEYKAYFNVIDFEIIELLSELTIERIYVRTTNDVFEKRMIYEKCSGTYFSKSEIFEKNMLLMKSTEAIIAEFKNGTNMTFFTGELSIKCSSKEQLFKTCVLILNYFMFDGRNLYKKLAESADYCAVSKPDEITQLNWLSNDYSLKIPY